MPTKRYYGRIADLPDQRDKLFSVAAPVAVPDSFTIVDFGVYDQGQLGSCTGHGSIGAFRNCLSHLGEPDWLGSRLAAYYYARLLEGNVRSDAGASVRDAMKGIHKYGALDEALWPYNVGKFATKPSPPAVASGLKHLGIEYQAVDNTSKNAVKAALYLHGNLALGITVYESFESKTVAKTGIVPMPKATESVLGGHCMRVVGYDDSNVLVANSWGPAWGMKGHCTLPWAYVTNSDLASDWWVWVKV